MQKKFVVLSAAMMMAVPTLGVAGMAGSNTVNSAAIIDGAVATVDIANRAVTAAKIADAAITATQLAAGAVTTGNLSDGSVTATKIAAGAVSDAHIVGPIATSKLYVGTASGSVAAGDHAHDAIYQKKYANTTVVAKGGADYTDPVAALNDVATWCGTPSATNPCLVKIMPGVYDLGSNVLNAVNFVDVDGSGKKNTILSGSSDIPAYRTSYYVTNTSLSNLTIDNNATRTAMELLGTSEVTSVNVHSVGNTAVLIGGNPTIVDVTVEAVNYGITVSGFGSGATLRNVKVVNAPGGAFYNYRGIVTIKDLETTSGVMNQGQLTIVNSAMGRLRLIPLEIPTATNVVNSQISDGMTRDNGAVDAALKCFNAYDANFNPIACDVVPNTW